MQENHNEDCLPPFVTDNYVVCLLKMTLKCLYCIAEDFALL